MHLIQSGSHLSKSRSRSARYLSATVLGLLCALGTANIRAQEQPAEGEEGTTLEVIVLSADDQLKQAPGVSTITSDDLQRTPPANDISEIVRKMPGANLTGTTASGQRGNQRQIELRGMGPENTLILIDGKPVLSRNSVRMGRAGERDSRGDTNWVPPEAIERIEVIRGSAATRYGSGAAGGVVNIIAKKPEKLSGSVSTYLSVPQHSSEGGTRRGSFMIGGPISDRMSSRLLGNIARTDADDADINADANLDVENPPAAGREGVTNRDIRGMLTFEPTGDHAFDLEATFSRQGNIFTGDRQNGEGHAFLDTLIGDETNIMKRGTLSLTHRGSYDFGDSNSYIQCERTLNKRQLEGLAGGPEGRITSNEFATSTLDNLTAKSEWDLPLEIGVPQTLTLGGEFRREWMDDPISNTQSLNGAVIPGTPDGVRDTKTNNWIVGLYAEDNIEITDDFILTPGVRFDHHSEFGANWSPSLKASYDLTDTVSLKAGIARAFKAPNLFQLNPNYVYFTMGMGDRVSEPWQRLLCRRQSRP